MCNMQCVNWMCAVLHWAVCSMQLAKGSVHCAAFNLLSGGLHCALYIAEVYSLKVYCVQFEALRCSVCSVHCTVSSSTVCSVQCVVYSVQCSSVQRTMCWKVQFSITGSYFTHQPVPHCLPQLENCFRFSKVKLILETSTGRKDDKLLYKPIFY